MERADQLLREGDLDACRASLIDRLKANPGDEQARMFFAQLLCVLGEWDKARAQFAALAKLSPAAQMLSIAYGQAIDAELVRAAVFAGEVRADLIVEEAWAAAMPDALAAYARGDDGDAIRDAVYDAAPEISGYFNDIEFEWMADADPRTGPFFEAIVAGKYGLLPMDAIENIRSEGAKDLRDIVWYPVEIGFRNGQSTAAFLPARYPGSERSERADIRLGRVTDWASDRPDAMVGQRVWTFDDGSEQPILALRNLIFG